MSVASIVTNLVTVTKDTMKTHFSFFLFILSCFYKGSLGSTLKEMSTQSFDQLAAANQGLMMIVQ